MIFPTMPTKRIFSKASFMALFMMCTTPSLADESGLPPASASSGYPPPNTPKLYEEGENGPGQKVDFGRHFFFAPSLVFGQSQSREDGASASVSYSLQIEGGRRAYLRSTRFVAASLAVFSGKLSDTLSDVENANGFAARIGYGYKIGEEIWGVVKLSSGLVFGNYSGATAEGYKVVSSEGASGSVVQAAFYLANKPENGVGFLGGIRHSLYNFDLGQIEIKDGDTLVEKTARGLVFASTEVEVGLQVRF